MYLPFVTQSGSNQEASAAVETNNSTTETENSGEVPFGKPQSEAEKTDSGGKKVAQGSAGILSPYFPAEVLRWDDLILKAAKKNGIDPNLFAALIWKESFYPDRCPDGPVTPSCTSYAGALSLAQVMPFHFGCSSGEYCAQGREPKANLFKGASILASYTAKKGGDIRLGLAAYNCGPNKPPSQACLNYADDILGRFRDAKNALP